MVPALLLQLQLQLLHVCCCLVPFDSQFLQVLFLVCHHTLHPCYLPPQALQPLVLLLLSGWLLKPHLQLQLLLVPQLRQQALLLPLRLLQLLLCGLQLLGKFTRQLLLKGQLL